MTMLFLIHSQTRNSMNYIKELSDSFFQEPTAIPSRKKKKKKKEVGVPEVGVSEERVCCKIVFL